MSLATASAAAAGATAALAYLDAKFHLRQDLSVFRAQRWYAKVWQDALKKNRLSPYYLFEAHALATPEAEALWFRPRTYTRREVYTRANQYGQFFLSRGVRPGQLVALFMRNSPDFVFAWIGLWSIGAAPALINSSLSGKALVHCVRISGAKLLLAAGDAEVLGRVEGSRAGLETAGVEVLGLDDFRSAIESSLPVRPGDELRKDVKPMSPYGLFYTSGTTGMPKGCMLPVAAGFKGAHSNHMRLYPYRGDGYEERCYNCMPLYHGTGGITMMNQMLNGTTVCLAPKFSVTNFWKDIRDSRATWLIYVGETLRYLVAAPPSPLDKAHNVHTVFGNGCRPDVWSRFQDRFGIETMWEFFNSTEGMLALQNPARNDWYAHAVGHLGLLQRRKYRDSYVAVAIDHETEDILRDPKTGFGKRVPIDGRGEIVIRVPFEREFPGYWNNPEATEKKFVRDLFQKGDCYFRTGDALRMDSEGRWFFSDRLGDTFRWKGENVSTAEVSEVCGKFPDVVEAIVYGVSLPGHDGKAGCVALYIEPEKRAKFDFQAFLKHVRANLPHYAVPIFVRMISESAASHNNKHNKVPLKKEGADPSATGAGDKLYWIEKLGKGDAYVPFTQSDWEGLGAVGAGKARL